jgi:hypothetical protein
MTLVELLVASALLMMLAAGVAGLTHTYWRELPQQARMIEANRSLAIGLQRMRTDVERATGLFATPDRALMIDTPGQRVCYVLTPERLERKLIDRQGRRVDDDAWPAQYAKARLSVRKVGDRPVALVVETWFDRDVAGQPERKLANAHVFFLPPRKERP